ncbi:mini-ribonuclease 3 [Alicyclobacillus contaminans]|uniref:Mini-ribonuclease 3 n=1 Tax=Alicyclobacillus contaminans TaxID=392016 RepID=UPI000478F90A|nr:ribonuclease III domain-containing protein [Alicyclobacillus contaminans]GMA50483.1 mini-ribonuclease 3 [Alicyclobacillus contaminans]
MTSWQPGVLSPLELAFIGDAVWELYARNHVLGKGVRRPGQLHRETTRYVRADAQAAAAAALWDDLTSEEQAIVRKGRNAKSGTVRKNAAVLDYRHSTGFEALIGYLYGQADRTRLDEVCAQALKYLDNREG